jgi:hypothetical protein
MSRIPGLPVFHGPIGPTGLEKSEASRAFFFALSPDLQAQVANIAPQIRYDSFPPQVRYLRDQFPKSYIY